MDTQQQQKMRAKVDMHQSDECKEGQEASPQLSPPSTSSSPTHEFSFAISLHQPTSVAIPDKARTPPSIAIDLTPADEIFFHGHLLPLHLLSHLPVSPRSSTNSLDSFTLPIRDLLPQQNSLKHSHHNITTTTTTTNNKNNNSEAKGRVKSKSFSLFGLSKRRKGCEVREENEEKEKRKRKLKFYVGHVLRRYMRMVRPLLSHFRERREKLRLRRQPYSFSGNLGLRGKKELRGRRGEYSAPASMRTSPTNSGLLLATDSISSSTSDSTMEELQAAIQAAIAHCKNSIAMEEKIKC